MKDELKRIFLDLAAVPGVSGNEGPIARAVAALLRPLVDDVRIDNMGNVIARKGDPSLRPRLMLGCHLDIIGCIVRSIDQNGFLRLYRMGGVVDLLLVGRKVWVNDVPGVVGVRPGHIQRPDERGKVPSLSDLYADVGAGSAEEVADLGIEIGSPIRYHSPVEEMANPDLLCGAYVDNRIGCAVLVKLMELIEDDLDACVYAVATTNEETGWRGGQMTAFSVDPDLAVAVDTTPAGGTPDVDYARELPIEIGKGPVLQVASQGHGAGFTAHPGVLEWLRSSADDAGLPYQLAALENANTDAVLIHMARGGVPTAALTIPRRYSHSPVELFDINDAVTTIEILRKAVHRLGDVQLGFEA